MIPGMGTPQPIGPRSRTTDLQNDLADLVEEERQEDLKTGIFLSSMFLSAWRGVRLVHSDRNDDGQKNQSVPIRRIGEDP
jgi:hypothetical protein